MGPKLDIVITGVGGQGTVLASRVLAQAAINKGLQARTSETIGMAQREGSVQSHVRIGVGDFGPLISQKQADILLAFEPAEAQRSIELLKNSGFALVNTIPIRPVTVAIGVAQYSLPEIETYLKSLPLKIVFLDAFELAVQAGNYKALNAVMLGALASSGLLPVTPKEILNVLLELVPERAKAVNEKAFELGSNEFTK